MTGRLVCFGTEKILPDPGGSFRQCVSVVAFYINYCIRLPMLSAQHGGDPGSCASHTKSMIRNIKVWKQPPGRDVKDTPSPGSDPSMYV